MTHPRERNNAADRQTGAYWEREFCKMAGRYGYMFTPHQLALKTKSAVAYERGPDGWNPLTLPDITIWSTPGEHHEIKHKNRSRDGMYGLERYRLDALVRFANATGQKVYYTIHDWELAGAKNSQERVPNDIRHWFVGDIAVLSRGCTKTAKDWTYYDGGMRRMEVWYWTASPRWFKPLGEIWAGGSGKAA